MVIISCSGKLHAFALAEQMAKHKMLESFFTSYAYQKNKMMRSLAKRVDKEEIPVKLIHTNLFLAFSNKLFPPAVHIWNEIFDKWVANQLSDSNSNVFIGWSGMSLHAIRAAKKRGMKTIVERGSTHISYQDAILREEYKRFGKKFSVHSSVIAMELEEYEEADYISVPSFFVKKTFLQKSVPEQKILVNPYGASNYFKPVKGVNIEKNKKFTIVYLGTLSVRKGLIYLMEALQQLSIPEDKYQVWFIGKVEQELQGPVEKLKKNNWKFFGHMAYYSLSEFLSQCDVGVQPSLEEGLSMVIPQMMACGVPVIVTPNSGGENIITDGINGMVVPVRNSKAIKKSIEELFVTPNLLLQMKQAALASIAHGFTWDDYGNRYVENLMKITSQTYSKLL